MTERRPFFSVVIPVYNREKVLKRCIESVMRQNYDNYEVIIIDDASTDSSLSIAKAYSSPKVKVAKHRENRGVCPTRNTGYSLASGEWVVPLDSDDELVDGALEAAYRVANSTSNSIREMKFMVVDNQGNTSPSPELTDGTVDYQTYLRSLDRMKRVESHNFYRKELGRDKLWPDDWSLEMLFHLDQRLECPVRTYPAVTRRYHSDAGNQSHQVFDPSAILRSAPDRARSYDQIVVRHGPALARTAPRAYDEILADASREGLLAGRRVAGLAYLLRLLARGRGSRAVVYCLAGLVSPRFLALLIALVRKHRYGGGV